MRYMLSISNLPGLTPRKSDDSFMLGFPKHYHHFSYTDLEFKIQNFCEESDMVKKKRNGERKLILVSLLTKIRVSLCGSRLEFCIN